MNKGTLMEILKKYLLFCKFQTVSFHTAELLHKPCPFHDTRKLQMGWHWISMNFKLMSVTSKYLFLYDNMLTEF